jgi:hypothetical protein
MRDKFSSSSKNLSAHRIDGHDSQFCVPDEVFVLAWGAAKSSEAFQKLSNLTNWTVRLVHTPETCNCSLLFQLLLSACLALKHSVGGQASRPRKEKQA